jgi:hypothetical protein
MNGQHSGNCFTLFFIQEWAGNCTGVQLMIFHFTSSSESPYGPCFAVPCAFFHVLFLCFNSFDLMSLTSGRTEYLSSRVFLVPCPRLSKNVGDIRRNCTIAFSFFMYSGLFTFSCSFFYFTVAFRSRQPKHGSTTDGVNTN